MCRYFPNLRLSRLPLLFLTSGLTVGLGGCPDYLTGQDQEPDGPILVTRLTLFDATSRDAPIFTDTSVPDCSLPQNQELRTCANDINRDKFSPKRSVPTPDSGREVRVVFNKLPAYFNGQEIERRVEKAGEAPKFMLADPSLVEISCVNCTATPPVVQSLILSGSDTTSDPTYPGSQPANIPYGPAILVQTQPETTADETNVFNGLYGVLEPETTYSFKVKAGVMGRNKVPVQVMGAADTLLTITTERFQLLRVGIGDATGDAWVYDKGDSAGPASYTVTGLANDGALRLVANAPLDESGLNAATATATVGGAPVPVRLGLSQLVMKNGKTVCDRGQRRGLWIFPAAGTWGMSGEVRVTVKGAEIRDLSQAAGHPAGRHALRGDITLSATLTGKVADASYKGVVASKLSAAADCPK